VANEILKIGLVGCGPIAQIAHIPAAFRSKLVRLVALCDRDQFLLQSVADKSGIKRLYTDYAEMLADGEIQAVIIAVPDRLHVSLAIQALEAGKHVLVEKPLGSTSTECRALVRLVDVKGLKMQVGCMKRHDPGVRFAHRHVEQKIGRILSFGAVYQDSVFRSDMLETCFDPIFTGSQRSGEDGWKADRRRYNLFTQGAHLFDMIRYLGGSTKSVYVRESQRDSNYSWHGLLEGFDGSIGHFELTCKSCGDWREHYHVCGENGNVEVDLGLWFYHRPAQVRVFDRAKQMWEQPLSGRSNAFANQLDAFADSVIQDKPTNPDARDGLAIVALLEAIEESIKSDRRVEVCEADGI